jgi:hypothetical protein
MYAISTLGHNGINNNSIIFRQQHPHKSSTLTGCSVYYQLQKDDANGLSKKVPLG